MHPSPYLTAAGKIDLGAVMRRAHQRARRERAEQIRLFGAEAQSYAWGFAMYLKLEMGNALNSRQIRFPRPGELIDVPAHIWQSLSTDGALPRLGA